MKYLKDIPDIHSCDDAPHLRASNLWEIPIRFINENSITEFYLEAKKALSESRANHLVSHVVACVTLAEFLGLVDHTQIKNYSTGV